MQCRIGLFALASVFGVVLTCGEAPAQNCTFSITDINFGNVANGTVNTSGTMNISCTGSVLGTVKVCPHFGEGTGGSENGNPRTLSNGLNTVDYQLYSNSGRTTVWGSNLWPFSPNPPTILVSMLLGSGSASQTIYARYTSGQGSALAGTYTSVLSGGHINIRYKYNDGQGCNSDTGGIVASPQPSFTVRADRTIACSVSANQVNFGAVSTLSSTVDGEGSLGVNCTRNTPYAVSLGNGLYGTSPTNRRMSRGGSERVTYGLYTNSTRTNPWGSATGQTLGGTGSGTAQNVPVYGRVPAQTTPTTGTYTDTVIVTVTY